MSYKRPRQTSPPDGHKRARGPDAPSKLISLGTELPQDENNDDGAFVPVWKQTVTDDRGRRRLHGAFTGGFSAGYFNTVGSKEGWAPKAFVSSRANRKKDEAQRAEDFMDDEDLAQAAESRQLETRQSAASIGRVGAANGDALFGLFVTEEETMGVKIAQKMGWRRDQGIGRKIQRPAEGDADMSGVPDAMAKQMYAPKDARVMLAPREDVNRKGLGYLSEARLLSTVQEEPKDRPMLALPFLDRSESAIAKKKVPKKASFGVGVLNDTGSDDEDPYELGPKITFNKSIGKDKKAKKPSKFVKQGVSDKLVVAKRPSVLPQHLRRAPFDGLPPLRGFVMATQIVDLTRKPRYSPLSIPPGWKSAKQPSTGQDTQHAPPSVADAAKSSTLDAKARASLLGEKLLPGKSVFDFIPKDARDRLVNLTGNASLPQGLGQQAPAGQPGAGQQKAKDLWSFVPTLDKSVAAAALAKGATGWMPYAEDPGKRSRYVSYLELRAGQRQDLPERAAGASVADWSKELQEFAHAAQVFKPTTGIMASRFTSSTSSGATNSTNGDAAADTLLRPPVSKPADPAEQAASLGMYGAMTRTTFSFSPSRLLCKRFNVRPPPDVPMSADAEDGGHGRKTQEAVSKEAVEKMRHEVLTRGVPDLRRPAWMDDLMPRGEEVEGGLGGSSASAGQQRAGVTTETETEGHAVVDVESNAALAQGRAPEDVFRAIFGDSEDEEEDV